MSFEERHTAWVDGTMDDAERLEFERELTDLDTATRERNGWAVIRERVRREVPGAKLAHGDFLNSQVLQAIERERTATARPERKSGGLFPISRLAWAGSLLLIAAAALTGLWLTGQTGGSASSEFVTRVIDAQSQDPAANAYVFAAPGGRGSVLWVEGAGYIAPTERL